MQPIPYLFDNGTCEEAFDFYGQVFGSSPEYMRVAGSPMESELPKADAHKIMHASLAVGSGEIYGSDNLGPEPDPAMAGCNVMVSLADVDTARRHFDALSEGGEVRMPFEPQFWTAGFGSFTDRYGIRWMVTTDEPPAP